jgi:hypothetical protein
MKQILLFIFIFITAASTAIAQTIIIPDAYFKNKLVTSYYGDNVAQNAEGASMRIDLNGDREIQVSEALQVYRLNLNNLNSTNIASLEGIRSFANLTHLTCQYNVNLTEVDVSGLAHLKNLLVGGNSLSSLNVSGCANLEVLQCGGNNLTELNLSELTNLEELQCTANSLTELDLSGLTNLTNLSCSDNQMTAIDLTPVNLIRFTATDSWLASIDLSTQTRLRSFSVFNSHNLSSVNLKNGVTDNFGGEEFIHCYHLSSICLDENEYEASYNSIVAMASGDANFHVENIAFSTTCDQGGEEESYNMIYGTVNFDTDTNGCNELDPTPAFIRINAVHNGIMASAWTNVYGFYSFIAQAGNYTIVPNLDNLPNFVSSAPAEVAFNEQNGSVITQYFCISAIGVYPDLEVGVGIHNNLIGGANHNYYLMYKNKGNQVLNGTITFAYNEDALDFVTAIPDVSSSNPALATWNFSGLQPLETRRILLTLHTNTPTSPYPVNIGDLLNFTITGDAGENDVVPEDNQLTFAQTVSYSRDPNNITCLEGNRLPAEKIGDNLHYTINFENIGTTAAQSVKVKAIVDISKYDIQSLEILDSSHEVEIQLEGNELKFKFEPINLEPEALGHVSFKIKSLNSLREGDTVMSQASIVFDENLPIDTNQAITTFETTTGLKGINTDFVTVYPNLIKDIVTIKADGIIHSVQLYDIQGRLLQTCVVNNTTSVLDISSRTSGMYFLKVITDRGEMIEKVMKK